MQLKPFGILIALLLLLSVPAFAKNDDLLQLDSAFINGNYDKVELLALRLLKSPDSLNKDEQARVNLTAGYAMIMLGREADARGYFRQALSAVPDLMLDPVQVSPKFRVVFDEVKAAMKDDRPQGSAVQSDNLSSNGLKPLTPPPAVAKISLLSNLLLPGTGQWREGHPVRGAVFLGSEIAAAAWLVWSLDQVNDSRKNYLSASDAHDVADKYDAYNQDYRMAWAAGIVTGAIYLVSQTDLILFTTPGHQELVRLSMEGTVRRPRVGLSVKW